MTTSLYINCCKIGSKTGDGAVGAEELKALREVSDVKLILDINKLRPEIYKQPYSVFLQDYFANALIKKSGLHFDLCSIYGNPYAITVENLKRQGTKVVVTHECHNREISIAEHEKLIGEYPFWHVKDDFGYELCTGHVRLADIIVSASSYNTQNIISALHVSEDKIVKIPHGCDYPDESKIKKTPEKFTVAFLSQAGVDKDIPTLIKAWSELGYDDAELILAGQGTETLEEFVKTIASNGHFRLLGRVPDASNVYNSCSVFVLPSMNESFGIPLVEAMSFGRPVITTSGCGACDAVTEGEDGFVVSPRDYKAIATKIDWFKTHPDEIKRMGANAREKAKEYGWNKIRERYKNIYSKLLGREK